MVSEIWVASEHGDLARVIGLLEAGGVDIEIKDQEGVTPLIAAAKNGHRDVVRALLDKGADPLNASQQGLAENYTSDLAIVDLLRAAAASKAAGTQPGLDPSAYAAEGHQPPRGYYMPPPPGPYYYPGMPPPDGAVAFYPPPPPQPANGGEHGQHQSPVAHTGHSNLPPPEIARLIPCRYFPACRYGASCMFAHPPGPYMPPPPPPSSQYPPGPYENGSSPPYPPAFYPMPPPPPPNFPSQNGVPPQHMPPPPPISPQSAAQGILAPPPPPPQAMMHSRSASDMLSSVQGAFPAGMPAMPYGPTSPLSPATYSNGALPQAHPLPMPPPMTLAGPQSPQAYPQSAVLPQGPVFEPAMEMAPTLPPPQSAPAQQQSYLPQQPPLDVSKTSPPIANGEAQPMNGHRDSMGHNRRGSFRRGPPFPSRKPPCAFFPTGRCRNGDECRFPHIMPDQHAPGQQGPQPFMGRGGRFRGPPGHGVNGQANANGLNGIEEGLQTLGLRDDQVRGRGSDRGTNSTSSSHARAPPGKNGMNPGPGGRPSPKPILPKQRVPNADEFPVLGGATTPPRSAGANGVANGHVGPTAAQVLQAAAPTRKEIVKDFFRGAPAQPQVALATDGPIVTPVVSTPILAAPLPTKLPVSFAAAATGLPDASKEVSVAA